MPFGIAEDNSSKVSKTTTTVTDQGQLNRRSAVAQGGSVLFNKSNLGPLAGLKKVKVGKKGTVNIQLGDNGAAVGELAGQVTEALQNLSSAQTQSTATVGTQVSSAVSGALQGAFDQLATLTESNNTGGTSTSNKSFVGLVLGVVALGVLALWVFRSK